MEVILHTKMAMIRQRIDKMEEEIKTAWGENKHKIDHSMKRTNETLRFVHPDKIKLKSFGAVNYKSHLVTNLLILSIFGVSFRKYQ